MKLNSRNGRNVYDHVFGKICDRNIRVNDRENRLSVS